MLKIALRNIRRNKRRTFLTGLSIAVAVMVVVYIWSFMMGIIQNIFDNTVSANSGHIRILNKDYVRRESMLPLEANIADYQSVIKTALANREVTLATGRIKFGVLLSYENNNKPILGVGIDPAGEEPVLHLSQKMPAGRPIVMGEEGMNIGDKLARELGLKLGDTLTIVTQTAYGSIAAMNLKIVGIFHFNVASVDGRVFYMPLDKAQRLLDLDGRVTEVFILIKNPDDAPKVAAEIAAKLNDKYDARPWQSVTLLYYVVKLIKYIYGAIYFIILILASFTILNTMFMSVLERTKEFGMMKALGLRDRQIMGIVLLEAALIGIVASLTGALAGAGIAYYLSVVGVDFSATFNQMGSSFDFPVSSLYRGLFRWSYVATGFGFGVLFAVLAAIPPALRAARLDPEEALRE